MRRDVIDGDCIEALSREPADVFDACVTDPPYGLSFMGRAWDRGVPGVPFWSAHLRVLKPGAHLLAFGGTRTVHRLACAIEDAGFEIRDMMFWLYSGNAMPKGKNLPGGFNTALKPACEPIVVARKPCRGSLDSTFAQYGTGALHVEPCRVPLGDDERGLVRPAIKRGDNDVYGKGLGFGTQTEPAGRFPANVAHDGSPDALAMLGDAARFYYCAKADAADRGEDNDHKTVKPGALMRYLCRLACPPGGVVLDGFCGSGSTLRAAAQEGFGFVGIDNDPHYVEIARRRSVIS